MNQEISVKKWNGEKNMWEHALSSYDNKSNVAGKKFTTASSLNILYRIRPYIGVQMQIQDALVTSMTLSVANPPIEFVKDLVGKLFQVTLAYSNIKGGQFVLKEFVVFTGIVVQPPYFREGGQGTDQILYIPLTLGALPRVSANKDKYFNAIEGITKYSEAFKYLFTENKYSAIKNIVYDPKTLANEYFKSSADFNLSVLDFSNIQQHFKFIEGLNIYTDNVTTLYVSTNQQLIANMGSGGNKNQKLNCGKVFNQSYDNRQTNYSAKPEREKNNRYVSSYIKTKFAVIGLDNSVSLELAFVLLNLIGKRYCSIDNIGTNIEIYQSKDGQADTTKAFYIQRQEIFFSTWGDSRHTISLLAQPKDNFNKISTQGAPLEAEPMKE